MKVIRNAAIALFGTTALALAGAAIAHGSKQESCQQRQGAAAQGEKPGQGAQSGAGHEHGRGMQGRMGGMHDRTSAMHERMGSMHAQMGSMHERMGAMHGEGRTGGNAQHQHN